MIRSANRHDASAIARIYNHYVLNTTVSFEDRSVPDDEMARRVGEILDLSLPYLVLEDQQQLLGYAYASRWHGRRAYRFAVETSIYLDPLWCRKGLGKVLYLALLEQLAGLGLHTAIGCIALPNLASIALHERLGFQQVAKFSQVGFKFGQWVDVGYWQRLF